MVLQTDEIARREVTRVLIAAGRVTRNQVTGALAYQKEHGGQIWQALIHLGHITEAELVECVAELGQGEAALTPAHYALDPTVMRYVPADVAVTHGVMPLAATAQALTVAVSAPLPREAAAALGDTAGAPMRTVLCDRATVHGAVEQYYGGAGTVFGAPAPGAEAIRLRGVLDIVANIDAFPLLPDVQLRLLQRLDDPATAIADLTPIFQRDPTLAANVLKLANSAAYSAVEKFTNLERALPYLGLRELRAIVLSSAVLDTVGRRARFDLTRLFHEAFECGLLTKIVADVARWDEREVAFTAGLLRNLGTVVLRLYSPRLLERVLATLAEAGRTRSDVEEALIGVSAAELAYQLARHWRIPDVVADGVRYHDRLDREPNPPALALAVGLARRCLEDDYTTGRFADPEHNGALAALLERMGLAPSDLIKIEALFRVGLEGLVLV